MSWLNLGAAPWLLVIPALIALYLFRPRPQRRPISSLRLWQAVPQIERTRAKLRRPPLTLLLLLQVVLLAAGSLALLQPALTAPPGRQLVLLLDASGSMQARSGTGTRFTAALAQAGQLAAGLGPDDTATLLRVGAHVTTACAACRRPDLERALAGLQVGAGQADLAAALGVAAGLARRAGDTRVETVVISDGAFASLAADDLPPALHFIGVGAAADNRAVTVLNARRPPDGSPGYVAYARVDNLGAAATVDVAALADTVPLDSRHLTLPGGGHADLVWQVPAGTARFTVSLNGGDALAADDRAVIYLPDARQRTVRISAAPPDLYQRALAGIPGVTTATEAAPAGADAAAFTIIAGRLPDPLPAGNLLLVNPSGALLPVRGPMQNVQPLAAGADHPLLAGLDLGSLLVQKAQQFAPVAWLQPLVQGEAGPLLLAGQQEGRRIVVLAFDPQDSNLPKLAAFPLLMANLVDWLDPVGSAEALRPGDSVTLAPGSLVTPPGGGALVVGPTGVLAETEQAGLYRVTTGPRAGLNFAVNMADAAESQLAPRPHPELERQAPPTTAGAPLVKQEFWPPLAALALLFLGAEWLFYCWKRGQR